jgi:mRNA interferase RelE/StbE
MANYQIEIKASAQKELVKLPKSAVKKLIELIDTLPTNPYPTGCKKLVGADHTYRIRTGDYRIVYSIFDERLTIHVIKSGIARMFINRSS